MKKIISQVSFLAIFLTYLSGCTTPSPQQAGKAAPSQVIKGVLKSATGEELPYTFNNAVNTMVILYQGETITLVGQPTGSGIKYTNDQYTYTDWQGNSTLQKDGVTIFKVSANSGKQK
ncbi:hypothetical protein AHMF7605_29245 [Adhaeribacter arboris]|uniref:C-type lysozyme inhibitor domain-containing protein n=1 Tax=Adhaeribacter arboris TaxID=2072846 RepID=A0A2T2Y911_9BACT|nr:MliC family protein [Adhaeribacter arboris]PSR51858.1 hypothetical protein AHMF7605_28505 [Adhaeribacter arboris]PSR51993.1 hypothetical protein AHMF7605_29245 [Adhaeribacter arboris]